MDYLMNKLQRGPVVTIVCSVIRVSNSCDEIMTTELNAEDVALFVLKFKGNPTSKTLQFSIRMKKNDKAKESAVINITCGTFNELILCSDQWMEAKIKEEIVAKYVNHPDGRPVYLYNFIVNITVHDMMSMMPPLPSNELHVDKEFTDFLLHTANGSVPVHKAMLFIHSNMFRTMLSGEWKETTEGRINIDGVTMQTLQHLKDYMYLGTLPDEGLESLLLIAARYLMDKLKTDCIVKLVKTIKPENFDGLVELACQNNIPDLVKALVLQIPDDVVTGIHSLTTKQESKSDHSDDKK